MARGKKTKARPAARKATKPKAKAKAKPKAKAKAKRDPAVDAVTELITVLACPKSVVNEMGLACENVIDQMDVACGFARFASTAWAQRPGQYGEIDEIARALVVEYERHAEALSALLDRLAPLAEEEEEADHEDLDPMDVLGRVQPMLMPPDDALA